jgi:hypothetical protein
MEVRKPSFSEEKEAKRLHEFAPRLTRRDPRKANKSFLVLFFKKEPLSCPFP